MNLGRTPLSTHLALAIFACCSLACPAPAGDEAADERSDEADSETDSATEEADDETDSETDSGATEDTGEPELAAYDEPGPYPVGRVTWTLPDPRGDRELSVELWYPAADEAADEAAAGQPLSAFYPDEPEATTFAELVAAAPDGCTRKQTSSAYAPTPAELGPLPTLVFSHCHSCARMSSVSIVERLVSHGFAVAAVDHVGDDLWAELAGAPGTLDGATLELRADDLRRVLDALLDPGEAAVPAALQGLFDAGTVGAFGHSFGSVTAGKLGQDDPRIRAVAGIAAPMENPLIPGVMMAEIDEPLLLLLAREDNSITELGNNLLRANFQAATTPAWLIEFADAGHWSFSDICELIAGFQPGCGDGIRQTIPDESFTYLDNDLARSLSATKITAFFALHLLADEDARELLDAEDADGVMSVSARE